MADIKRFPLDVSDKDREVLERALDSGTVQDLHEAETLGVDAVVREQLDFERRMEERIIPRLQEMREDPSIGLTVEEARARTEAIVRQRLIEPR